MTDTKKPSKMPTPENELVQPLALRVKEAAQALGIGERLLWTMTQNGEIPHRKVGRCTLYPVHKLKEWLEMAG